MQSSSHMFRETDACQYSLRKCYIPQGNFSISAALQLSDDFRTSDMIRVPVEASKVIGDKKIWSLLLNKHIEELHQFLPSLVQSCIPKVLLNERGDPKER